MPESATRRIVVLYNTDYDDELIAAVDVSAVRESAKAITAAIAEWGAAQGLKSELVGVHGRDLDELVARFRDDPPELVFNLCESLAGDARNEIVIPALLDMLGVPFTGTGSLELGLCLHKERAKDILFARGVATPPYLLIESETHLAALRGQQSGSGSNAGRRGAVDDLDYPYFLKLAHEDASIGIEARNRVENASQLSERASELLAKYRQPVVAEKFIAGREVNVTVIGNRRRGGSPERTEGSNDAPTEARTDELDILPLHEIDFAAMPEGSPHIVSYAAKWDENHSDYAGTLPVPLRDVAPETEAAICRAAKAAFVALGLRDFGRVDLRIDEAGEPWVIDVNPNCDLSPDAGVARAAAYAGIAYPQLVGRICEIAWRRHEHTRHRRE